MTAHRGPRAGPPGRREHFRVGSRRGVHAAQGPANPLGTPGALRC